jgi:hypothetical protein
VKTAWIKNVITFAGVNLIYVQWSPQRSICCNSLFGLNFGFAEALENKEKIKQMQTLYLPNTIAIS